MEGATIRVNTTTLVTKANAVEALIQSLENNFDTMQGVVSRSGEYWIGEAGNAYRTEFRSEYDVIKQMVTRLRRLPRELKEMAGVYQGVNQTTSSIASSLPSDILG